MDIRYPDAIFQCKRVYLGTMEDEAIVEIEGPEYIIGSNFGYWLAERAIPVFDNRFGQNCIEP